MVRVDSPASRFHWDCSGGRPYSGASRSGVTMTMARQLSLDRLSAARFSLLLSVPVIGGAAVLKTAGLITAEIQPNMPAIGSNFMFVLYLRARSNPAG